MNIRINPQPPIYLIPGHFGGSDAWIRWSDIDDRCEHYDSPVTLIGTYDDYAISTLATLLAG